MAQFLLIPMCIGRRRVNQFTGAEWIITAGDFKILWDRSPLPVREIRLALAEGGRELAHTSVITTLGIMVRKKYLRRTKLGNAYLFTPDITREAVSDGMLGDIVNRVFDGSPGVASDCAAKPSQSMILDCSRQFDFRLAESG